MKSLTMARRFEFWMAARCCISMVDFPEPVCPAMRRWRLETDSGILILPMKSIPVPSVWARISSSVINSAPRMCSLSLIFAVALWKNRMATGQKSHAGKEQATAHPQWASFDVKMRR